MIQCSSWGFPVKLNWKSLGVFFASLIGVESKAKVKAKKVKANKVKENKEKDTSNEIQPKNIKVVETPIYGYDFWDDECNYLDLMDIM